MRLSYFVEEQQAVEQERGEASDFVAYGTDAEFAERHNRKRKEEMNGNP